MSPREKSCLLMPKEQKLRKLFRGGVVVTTWGSPPRLPPAGPRVCPAYAYLVGMAGARGGRGGRPSRSAAAGAAAAPPPRWPPATAAIVGSSFLARAIVMPLTGGVAKAVRVVASDI